MVVYTSDVVFHSETFCLSLSIAACLSEVPDNSCCHGCILFHFSFVEPMLDKRNVFELSAILNLNRSVFSLFFPSGGKIRKLELKFQALYS